MTSDLSISPVRLDFSTLQQSLVGEGFSTGSSFLRCDVSSIFWPPRSPLTHPASPLLPQTTGGRPPAGPFGPRIPHLCYTYRAVRLNKGIAKQEQNQHVQEACFNVSAMQSFTKLFPLMRWRQNEIQVSPSFYFCVWFLFVCLFSHI